MQKIQVMFFLNLANIFFPPQVGEDESILTHIFQVNQPPTFCFWLAKKNIKKRMVRSSNFWDG